jgi:preprotein translocase subunit SecB
MTDVPAAPDGADPQAQPGIRILAQFIRDLSFENPRAPESLRAAQAQPQIELGVEMSARGRPDQLFEVDLKLTATARHEGEVSFAVELVYGGLFQLGGVAEPDIEAVLLIECPRFLFPFARRIIADCSAEGGFPPLLLEPIDFAGVYQSQRQGQAEMLAAQPVGTA